MATTNNDWTPLDAYDVERSIRPRGGGGGHLISGSFYIIFGLGLLILSIRRARCHTLNTSFPEQDMITLYRISIAVCLAGVLGILIHGLYGGVYVLISKSKKNDQCFTCSGFEFLNNIPFLCCYDFCNYQTIY